MFFKILVEEGEGAKRHLLRILCSTKFRCSLTPLLKSLLKEEEYLRREQEVCSGSLKEEDRLCSSESLKEEDRLCSSASFKEEFLRREPDD